MYETYEEQLKSKEWRLLRKSILGRDSKSCTICNNKKILAKTTSFYYFSEGTNQFDKSQFFVIIPQINAVIEIQVPREAIKGIKDPEKYKYHLFYKPNGGAFLAAIVELSDAAIAHYVCEGLLEIHHKYYQQGCRAWEYPEDALQTLCWNCHEEIHRTSRIPKKNSEGKIIGNMTPCSRCFGTGRLPQYSHVESGICFRCRGAQYDELI